MFSGACGKYVSKIISLLLVIVTLFTFVIPVSAEDGGITFNTLDMQYAGIIYNQGTSELLVTDEMDVSIYNVSGTAFKGYVLYYFPYNTEGTNRIQAVLILGDNLSLNSEHEYSMNFSWGYNQRLTTSLNILINYYDPSTEEVLKTQVLYTQTGTNPYTPQDVSFDFKPDTSGIDGGYKCSLIMQFNQTGLDSTTSRQAFFVSPEINLIDKDDNSGWFQKIINKINDVWESIKSLPDKIGAYIQQIATDITDGLKSLFIPEDGFLDEKKAELELFLEEHFGILYTAPNILFTILERLMTISPEEPSLTMPAIEFIWQGEKITLTEPITIYFNDYISSGAVLETFYKFYRAFVSVSLILMFVNYAKNKYDYLFGKDGEAVE